jgi:hypothetical protein
MLVDANCLSAEGRRRYWVIKYKTKMSHESKFESVPYLSTFLRLDFNRSHF